MHSCRHTGASPCALFDVTRTTMPSTNPVSLPAETYATLVASVLEQNEIVAGEAVVQPLSDKWA
jgi:hypothetical protein